MILESRLALLRDRATMRAQLRRFFEQRSVWEVDCPHLNLYPACDAHIDPMQSGEGYLHTSPEYAMKKLLAAGSGDIYQLSHVFRAGESGDQHQPEFTLIEWYRVGMDFNELIRETVELCELFLGNQSLTVMTYRDAFKKHAYIDPLCAPIDSLRKLLPNANDNDDRDSLLNLLLAAAIEPHLGQEGITALTHYPPSQAALARIVPDGAERFELYYKGIELANGYHELNDSAEQRKRFQLTNDLRSQMGKLKLPLDEDFIHCLDALPDCCGVAVGFDRLMMLRHNVKHITEVVHS